MAALSQSTRRKLSLLQLAQELGNVAKACRLMGYHRDTFYEVRRAFQVGGVQALVEQRRGPRGPHPNRVRPPRSRPGSSLAGRVPIDVEKSSRGSERGRETRVWLGFRG